MKTVMTLLILIITSSSLQATSLSMSQFKKVHRQMVLSDFKSLFKKRHMGTHKAQLRHKYSRVKSVQHPSILNNRPRPRPMEHKDENTNKNKNKNPSMQIPANKNFNTIQHNPQDTRNPFIRPHNVDQPINKRPDVLENRPQVTPPQEHIPNTDVGNRPTQLPNPTKVDMPLQDTQNMESMKPEVSQPKENVNERPTNTQENTESSNEMQEDMNPNEMQQNNTQNEDRPKGVRSLNANVWGRR